MVETLLDKAGTSASVELKNTGKSTLFARIITEGIPEQGEEKAYANGVSLAVSYVDLNGSRSMSPNWSKVRISPPWLR